MRLFSKTAVLIMLFLPGLSSISAQGLVGKPIADTFAARLRAGGQAYIVPHISIGREALRGGMLSRVGMQPLTSLEKVKYQVYNLGRKHLSQKALDRLVAQQLAQEPFPGYYVDFEKSWERAQEQISVTLGRLEVILEAAYGEDTPFEGAFVKTYREVLYSLHPGKQTWTNEETLEKTLKETFKQACEKKEGFFMIIVRPTEEHGRDVLLLDLKNIKFISVNKSIGTAWDEHHAPVGR